MTETAELAQVRALYEEAARDRMELRETCHSLRVEHAISDRDRRATAILAGMMGNQDQVRVGLELADHTQQPVSFHMARQAVQMADALGRALEQQAPSEEASDE